MQRLVTMVVAFILALGTTLTVGIMLAPPNNTYSPLINSLRRSSPGCELPCWHDLVPGVTTFDQTKTILGADPAFDQVDIYFPLTSREDESICAD